MDLKLPLQRHHIGLPHGGRLHCMRGSIILLPNSTKKITQMTNDDHNQLTRMLTTIIPTQDLDGSKACSKNFASLGRKPPDSAPADTDIFRKYIISDLISPRIRFHPQIISCKHISHRSFCQHRHRYNFTL